ncbi:MAG: ribonuclease P protein component [Crocinitomicaceae bacterium]|nr:ribonuclease P protein component [Crocinitomicaceae bacterium]
MSAAKNNQENNNAAKRTLSKEERLTRKKIIEDLYENGASIRITSLILVYKVCLLPVDFPAQVMFSASKRIFKKAHDRNRVKRLMREAYRKQKHIVYTSLKKHQKQAALTFIFTGCQLPDQAYMHGKIFELMKRFQKEMNQPKRFSDNGKNQ